MASEQRDTAMDECRQMVLFCLEDEQFALDINSVREIVRPPVITRLPGTPAYIAGIVNLRGEILSLIDTRVRMSMQPADNDERTRVLVVERNGFITGLLVDAVISVNQVRQADIQPTPPAVQIESRFLSGVMQKDADSLVLLMDIEEVVKFDICSARPGTSGTLTDGGVKHHAETIDELQLVTFQLGREEYAFEVDGVQEIMRVGGISDVPNAPDYIRGLITVRDRIIPAFDLRSLLGLDASGGEENERILVVETGEFKLGMMVDRVREVSRYPKHIVHVPPEQENISELKGIVKVENGRRLIMILDQSMLLSDEDHSSIMEWIDNEGVEEEEMDEIIRTEEQEDGVSGTDVQVVSFNLGDEEYGIDIKNVQEINRPGRITSMPKAPEFIEGVTNLRGDVIPVIDTRRRFGMTVQEYDDRTRIIIVDMAGRKTGLVADRVNEVMRIPADSIAPPPPMIACREESRFFSGIGKLDSGNRMILLLDVEKILNFEEQQALQAIPTEDVGKTEETKGGRGIKKGSTSGKSVKKKKKGGKTSDRAGNKKSGQLEIDE